MTAPRQHIVRLTRWLKGDWRVYRKQADAAWQASGDLAPEIRTP